MATLFFTHGHPLPAAVQGMQRTCARLYAALLLLCAALTCSAHDIPGKVTVLSYIKPQADQLLVLVRVPMEALTEVQFPLREQGYLDFERADAALSDAARIYVVDALQLRADGVALDAGQLLRARVAPPADKSFTEFGSALALVNSARLDNDTELPWKQGWLDVLIRYPAVAADARISLEANFARLGVETHTVLRYQPPQRTEVALTYSGNPGLIQLEPSWWFAASRFVSLGFVHILAGVDHLLFLFCLVVVARSVRLLLPVITAFTVAHSITLISAAFGFTPNALWFPPLIETSIALSVFYMACENILGARLERRWLLVFAFGLVHGFGFSFILADRMQFAGSHLTSALLAFNVGVELGQLAVLLVTVPLLRLFFKYFPAERIGTILLSAIAAHSAWHWFTERGTQLLQYRWEAPTLDAAFFAAALRWTMLLMLSAGILWLMHEVFRRMQRPGETRS